MNGFRGRGKRKKERNSMSQVTVFMLGVTGGILFTVIALLMVKGGERK